jgi:hypothetical protein
MKKITSQKFSKRLAQYGALSVAIAGVAGANAQDQIGYTNIDPDYSGTPDPYYVIDFDGDAFGDLVIVSNSGLGVLAFAYGSNKVLGSVYSFVYSSNTIGLVYPFALDSGAVISAGQNSWLNATDFYSGNNILNVYSCYFGVWCDVQDKFIGVQFKIGSNTHYGWARLDVATNGNIWTLKDFAYNKTPDASINAGQTTSLGIENNELNKIKVVALNKSIGLYNLPERSSYNIFSITGKNVLKGNTSQRDYVIEVPTLASGVYVLELTDTNSKGVIRKKVVLQ